MKRNNDELTLIEAMAAYPYGVWTIYRPSGEADVEHVPSLTLAVALSERTREGKQAIPETTIARWEGEGGLMILLESGEWRQFLRLEDTGPLFLTRDEVAEWRELALTYGRGSDEMKQFYRRVMR